MEEKKTRWGNTYLVTKYISAGLDGGSRNVFWIGQMGLNSDWFYFQWVSSRKLIPTQARQSKR